MDNTPKGNRLHIALFGRTNVGKSSLLNMITGQETAITSPRAGTTTDVVEKAMELLPLGPVLFLDTAGLDDVSALSQERIRKTEKIFDRADIVLLVLEPGMWTDFEEKVVERAGKVPVIGVVNKADLEVPSVEFEALVKSKTSRYAVVSSSDISERHVHVEAIKKVLVELCPDDFIREPPILGDLMPRGGLAVLVVPIDMEAPKGRIILPQVQTIRDALDHDQASVIVKEDNLGSVLDRLKDDPDLVVCDSQVVDFVCGAVPERIPTTTFSMLFSRYKGDLAEQVRGAARIRTLGEGDSVLIAEACTHHPVEDDIGRVKIPRWLREYAGENIEVDVRAGKEYPDDLERYSLVVHCGGCMLNRAQMLSRIRTSVSGGVPITNYGICISYLKGVLGRTLRPFEAEYEIFRSLEGAVGAP